MPVGRRTIKRGAGKKRIHGKDFLLAEEIEYIRSRAAEHDGRLVTVGPLVLFSTETGEPLDETRLMTTQSRQERGNSADRR